MTAALERLRAAYVDELRRVRRIADAEFARALKAEGRRGLSRADAEAVVRRRRGPPAAHPRVLAVFRKYFFACQARNGRKKAGGPGWVDPLAFVFEDLMGGRTYALWEFLAELDYFPLGQDRDGKWI